MMRIFFFFLSLDDSYFSGLLVFELKTNLKYMQYIFVIMRRYKNSLLI